MKTSKKDNWKKEYNFIKGYATRHKLRNTLIALTLAVKYHNGAKRDGSDEPYIIHPLMVCKTLILLNVEKALREWYPNKDIKDIHYDCDTMYAAAILHDVVEDCNLPNRGQELVDTHHLEEEVLHLVRLLSKPEKKEENYKEKYYAQIRSTWKTRLIKISDRANNCSTMQAFEEKRMIKYILETKECIYPLCADTAVEYPEFSDIIIIMKNLIVSVCETAATFLGKQDFIVDEDGSYEKSIQFIEGAARDGLPNTQKALAIAVEYHKGQKRASGDPFIIHPLRVCTYLMALGIDDDITLATCLLHEITRKCKERLTEGGYELVDKYDLNKKVIENVQILSNKDVKKEEYYCKIKENPQTLLEKLSNRMHTCTRLVDSTNEEISTYILETKEHMVPMCEYGVLHYPKYANQIDVMEMHILAICNMVEVMAQNSNKKEKTG